MLSDAKMPKALDSIAPREFAGDRGGFTESREILVPHEPGAGRSTAVRNLLIQSSLLELKENGYYERYSKNIDPKVLESLLASLAPGWIPMDLALAHYQACERLELTPDELSAVGTRVGTRVQSALLVSLAKTVREANYDIWMATGQLNRMLRRLHHGGSVQMVKVGPKDKLLEERGFQVTRYNYVRQCHLAVTRATYAALGASVKYAKIVSYDAATDDFVIGIGWL
jgi:hypothetical protein